MAFDQMIIAIAQYFELVDLTSYKIEDLWLNLLEVLCLERPNKYTVFKAVHYQGFRNIVLKDPLMQQIIREVDSYKDSGYAHMNPAKHLEKIYNIRRKCTQVEEPYSEVADDLGLFSESLRLFHHFRSFRPTTIGTILDKGLMSASSKGCTNVVALVLNPCSKCLNAWWAVEV